MRVDRYGVTNEQLGTYALTFMGIMFTWMSTRNQKTASSARKEEAEAGLTLTLVQEFQELKLAVRELRNKVEAKDKQISELADQVRRLDEEVKAERKRADESARALTKANERITELERTRDELQNRLSAIGKG